MQLRKHRYYYDREGNLVKVVSERIDGLDMYAVMIHPKDPFIGNVYFVHSDGMQDQMIEDAVDLIEDRTCPTCDGRGTMLVRKGSGVADTAEMRACSSCGARGFRSAST